MWRALLFLVPLSLPAADLATEAIGVLGRHCTGCHGADKAAGLDLRTRSAMMEGGHRGAVVIPYDPDSSILCQVVGDHPEQVGQREARILKDWVEIGAPWPGATAKLTAIERPLTDRDRRHWAYVKPRRVKPPRGGNPIDAFLDAQGPEARRQTLVRRAWLDVLGLPPSPEEMERFLVKPWTEVVEHLLASPHYGERWASHWLDVVRYADSSGYEFDWERPQAWRYRDWVVDAFNRGKPYDRFLREQIAGDELDGASTETRVATGFLRLGAENNLKNETTRMDELDDVVATTMAAFQGMNIGCARCHDHKYDPISRHDYHRVQAVFHSIRAKDYPLADAAAIEGHQNENRRIDQMARAHRDIRASLERRYRPRVTETKIAKLPAYMQTAWRKPVAERTHGERLTAHQIEKTLEITEAEIIARMSEEDRAAYRQAGERLAALEQQRPRPLDTIMAIGEYGRDPLPSAMEPGAVQVIASKAYRPLTPAPEAETSYRRRGFADWLASPENPLTARVMVNRIWQHHFGRGLVPTENNFGRGGERPSNAALLDWLAVEFIESGWSVKAVERLILNSDTYRARSFPRRRLEAEVIRDAVLAASGLLDRAAGGPGVKADGRRRGLYLFRKRSARHPFLEVFDQPDAAASCARRGSSATAVQSLALMNNPLMREAAAALAARVSGPTDAYRRILARDPSPDEQRQAEAFTGASTAGLADFCHLLFNLNEFLYLQ